MKSFDVIVCGAGPAGCTAALFLAHAGKKVLVLEKEKFPRDKVCADNKTWKCLDIIRELGQWETFQKLPKREIKGVLVASPAGNEMYTPLWPADIAEKGPWYNVRRVVFDNFLANACKENKNIEFRENCQVVGPIIENGQVVGVHFLCQRKLKEARGKVVVGADGSSSSVAKALGLDPELKGRYAMNARAYFENVAGPKHQCELYYLKGICPGYFWLFPVDGNNCNVGIGMRLEDIQIQKINLEEKLKQIIQSEKFKKRFKKARQITQLKQWGVSVLPGKRRWSGAGFVLTGDAGTFAMTFSGEGVGPAMRSGKIAAQAILQAFERNDFSASSLKQYDEMMWEILQPEVEGFKWLEFLILHEKIFDWVVKRGARNKKLIEISSKMQRDYSLACKMINPSTIWQLVKG